MEHRACSENFYKECVQAELVGDNLGPESKAKMQQILQRMNITRTRRIRKRKSMTVMMTRILLTWPTGWRVDLERTRRRSGPPVQGGEEAVDELLGQAT